MIAAQVGGKATRDTFFLDVFGAEQLPKAMLAAAVLSPIAVVLMTQGLAKLGPARLVPLLFGVSAAMFVGEYAIAATHPRAMAGVTYLHVAILGALLVSGFWSVVSERFDPHTAKQVIGRITAGATAGGLLGGVLSERVAAWFDARIMLLFLSGLSALTAVIITRIGAGESRPAEAGGILGGLKDLREAPYLKMLCGLVILTALTSTLVDYAFKAEADRAFEQRETLMTVFAIFYTGTGLVTFAAQTLLSRRALMRLGIGGTIALLPGAVMLGATLGAAVTRLWSVIVARAAEEVLSNSLYRAGYELLFTPLTPERKRPTKTLIDVGFKRVGAALGSGAVMLVVAVAPAHASRVLLIVVAVASASALWLALYLHRGYVAELASSLLAGRIEIEEADVVDATTRRTLADTTMAINRQQLLAQIEELRASQATDDDGDSSDGGERPVTTASRPPPRPSRELTTAVDDFTSGDHARVRTALRRPLEPSVVPFVVPLLGEEAYGRGVRRALRQVAPNALGTLIDALLDDRVPDAARRRLPDIIASVPSRRAALGLFEGITRGNVTIRDRCVSALTELLRERPSYRPRSKQVFRAAARELDRDHVSLSRVFALLGLTLDAKPLQVALEGLRSDDPNLRGTSYEYLENVLPESLQDKLWPHLESYASGDAPLSRRHGDG